MTNRIEVPFRSATRLYPAAKEVLAQAANMILGPGRLRLVPLAEDDPETRFMGFGVESPEGVRTLSPAQMMSYPNAYNFVAVALHRYLGLEWDISPENSWVHSPSTLYLDIETHSVLDRWEMSPNEFFRLGQFAWGDDPEIRTTTSYAEVIDAVAQADRVVAHNGHSFDLSVLFGKDSHKPLHMAQQDRVFDTMIFANLTLPAPDVYTDRSGRTVIHGQTPKGAAKWLGLDNLCYQLGLSGKEGDLKALAKEFGGFGNIPTNDERFLAYAVQDVEALRELTLALVSIKTPDAYDWREQKVAAIMAQISRNGFKVDVSKATARRDELLARKEEILTQLQEDYDFPTGGTMPWRTNQGKEAIFKILADNGITPLSVPNWTRTATGNLSLGGQVMLDITEGTAAEGLGRALAEVMGQRSLAQSALDWTQPDEKVHPEISAFQRSGRWSLTDPGLTVWTSRGDGAIEKSYFVPDSDDELLVELDYSAADARIVAGYSGDKEFAKRFEEGVDAHELTGRVVFGDKLYDSDPKHYRHVAKTLGHAYAYRAGPKKLAASSGQPLEVAEKFVRRMQEAYPLVTRWQNRVTEMGESGWITNDWGRKMVVEDGRAYTQAPALLGQSGTRDLLVDGLLRMLEYDIRLILWLKAQIHDALVASIPKSEIEWAVPKYKELMQTTWKGIEFPVGVGEPATDWEKAAHG